MFRVDFEGGSRRSFLASPGHTVLDQGLAAGLALPNGCLAGGCGACKARILSGRYRMDSAAALTVEERGNGGALLCQTFAESDLRIEIPESGETGTPVIGRITEIVHPIADVAVVRIALPQEALRFAPGQFVQLLLKDGTSRNYSIASSASDCASIELHIRRVEGGRCSPRFFPGGDIRAGMKLRLRGPAGNFTLRPSALPKVLLATGTGYAPLRSMLLHLAKIRSTADISMYWGAAAMGDLYAREEAHALVAATGGRFVPVLSRAAHMRDGRLVRFVQDAALADFPDMRNVEVYACGSARMIESASGAFEKKAGLRAANFFSDAFLPAGGGPKV